MKHIITLCFALCASATNAHPGHDHSHWLSGGVHTLLLFATVASVSLALIVAYNYWKNTENK